MAGIGTESRSFTALESAGRPGDRRRSAPISRGFIRGDSRSAGGLATVYVFAISIVLGGVAAIPAQFALTSGPRSEPAEPAAAVTGPTQAKVTAVNGDDDDLAMLDWAIGRVSALPGALPDVLVDFEPANQCKGNNAYYTRSGSRIDFCNEGDGDLAPRQTMLHELAHAWSFEHMTGQQIDEFLELRGLHEWKPEEVAWWQSGQEQVAEILAWGLMGDRPFSSKWTRWESCTDLAAAFTLVTHRSPDRPHEACKLEEVNAHTVTETVASKRSAWTITIERGLPV